MPCILVKRISQLLGGHSLYPKERRNGCRVRRSEVQRPKSKGVANKHWTLDFGLWTVTQPNRASRRNRRWGPWLARPVLPRQLAPLLFSCAPAVLPRFAARRHRARWSASLLRSGRFRLRFRLAG